MRRRAIIWFAVVAALLIVVASPASAAGVVSENSTATELNNADTLTNLSVQGTGESASAVISPPNPTVTIENFEDNDKNIETSGYSGWNGDTGDLLLTTGSLEGTYSGYLRSTGDSPAIEFTRSSRTSGNLTFKVKPGSQDGNTADGVYITLRGSFYMGELKFRDDGEVLWGGNNLRTWSSGQTYDVKFEFGGTDADQLTVYIDGSDEGTFSVPGGGWDDVEITADKSNTGQSMNAYIDSFETENIKSDARYVGQPHEVDGATRGFVELSLNDGSANATLQANDGGGWTDIGSVSTTSGGTHWVNISDSEASSYTQWRWDVNFTQAVGSLDAEGIEADGNSPTLSNPTPTDGSQVSDYSGNVSINLTDPDFGRVQGDNITLTLRESGDVVGSTTATSNGTVEIPYSAVAGTNSLTWEANDSYGSANATFSQSFTTPATLFIREETNTSKLITGTSNLTLRFFGGDLIVERPAENGTVDMTGLPATEEIVVVARADGYYSRRAVLGSLYEQQSIYMLSKNESAVFNEFVIDDRVGLFSSNQTKIRLEKGITQNGSTEWKTLTGDYLGAGRSFSVTLQQDARYRVYVENQQGDVRNVGPHIATADGVVPVPIGQIVWEAPKGDTYKWKSSLDEDSNTLQFEFVDEGDETTNFEVKAYVKGNESNPIFEDSQASLGTYQATAMLTENETKQQIIVEWSAERNGEEIGETNRAGAVGEWDVPVDQRWLTSGALLFLVAITWLMPSAMARVGSVMVVAVAFGMSSLGIVPIPLAVIGISGATALLGLAAEFRR